MALPFKPSHVNLYALAGADGWTVIDPGPDLPDTRAAWAALRAGPLAGPVARLFVTHHHLDHVGLAAHVMATEGCPLFMSRTAWLMARMLGLDVQERPTPEQVAFWRAAGMPAALLAERAGQRPFNQSDLAGPLPLGYVRLRDGDAFDRFTVRRGDGHAPEHLTLWADDLVVGGDQLLATISPNLGVYPTEPGADTVGEWLAACRALAAHATEAQLVLPGHGVPYRGLPGRLAALLENHVAALDRMVAAFAARPSTAVDAFDPLYRRRIGGGEFGLALAEAVGHVNHLAATGRIVPAGHTADGGRLWRAAGA